MDGNKFKAFLLHELADGVLHPERGSISHHDAWQIVKKYSEL